MPAIISHHLFGQDVYRKSPRQIGGTQKEHEAFLLGNQGPDPLFYLVALPPLSSYFTLGSLMHQKKPNELLFAFKQSLSILDEKEYTQGRAYLLGFLCHYLLDSYSHPFVYSQEYAFCNAGITNLTYRDAHEVHAVIESDLDEMMLFTRREKTIATFNPADEALRGSSSLLTSLSKMYSYVALTVYGTHIPSSLFASSLKSFRRISRFFHSRTGIKRDLLGRIEEQLRPYSFIRAMSHRPLEQERSSFGNHAHSSWKNPFTGESSCASFEDLYNQGLRNAPSLLNLIDQDDFALSDTLTITRNCNFSGELIISPYERKTPHA